MPRFWPPKPNRFWNLALEPLRRHYLHRFYGITQVEIIGMQHLQAIGPSDGLLIAPNHSHDSDPHVMMHVGREIGRCFYFMAAWQIFRAHRGIDGWIMQRMGAFSVDREGCDRRAVRQAMELLARGKTLVVFPEGEVYRTNERLTPLLEGVPFMALNAQKDLDKSGAPARVWIVPTAIRYRYVDDILPQLEASMARLESRMKVRPPSGMPLHERITRYGEFLLTIKEKEITGHSREDAGSVAQRVEWLINALLERREKEHLNESPSAPTVPLRVKALRRHLIEIWTDDSADANTRLLAREALDDVQLALQLYSYPGNYVSDDPTVERMAETIEKYEEDLEGVGKPKGRRQATIHFGPPIDLKPHAAGRARTVTAQLTEQLEDAIETLMRSAHGRNPGA
ncbi:MAG TPA: lysophospholipid acyltransferase family protein [Tepidisphaeraceae bacterium]|nr:lysophospholipid acyltransferase family protein [Tepidisphaeraceae bacterium]